MPQKPKSNKKKKKAKAVKADADEEVRRRCRRSPSHLGGGASERWRRQQPVAQRHTQPTAEACSLARAAERERAVLVEQGGGGGGGRPRAADGEQRHKRDVLRAFTACIACLSRRSAAPPLRSAPWMPPDVAPAANDSQHAAVACVIGDPDARAPPHLSPHETPPSLPRPNHTLRRHPCVPLRRRWS